MAHAEQKVMFRISDVCLDGLSLCPFETKRNVVGKRSQSLCLVCSEQTVEEE